MAVLSVASGAGHREKRVTNGGTGGKRKRSSVIQLKNLLVAAAASLVSLVFLFRRDSMLRPVAHTYNHDAPQVATENRHSDERQMHRSTLLRNESKESIIVHDMDQSIQEALSETCFPFNSKDWLEGRRLGNANDPLLTDDYAYEMILRTPSLLSGRTPRAWSRQTICHDQSRFLNWTDIGNDDMSLHMWAVRLTYLSFYLHQHNPAMKEAQARKAMNGQCKEALAQKGIGNFDFECPDAKFLVIPMGKGGLGSVMRLGVVNGLLAGMATNRTVLFVNNSPVGHDSLRKPWVHASCDRQDIQCFFFPPTPCVLTEREIAEAHVLERSETRKIFQLGECPAAHANDRVLVANLSRRPQRTPLSLRPNLFRLAQSIIDDIREANVNDPRIPIMERAAELILQIEEMDVSRPYSYFGVNSKPHHAAIFFTMRPSLSYARLLDNVMNKVFPADFNPELALGLPIRDSDKCLVESECLSFVQYMKLMGQVWNNNQPLIDASNSRLSLASDFIGNIVLTTESRRIITDTDKFEADPELRKGVPFAYRFITNNQDVLQGTGLPADFVKHNVTADEVMLSSVSALKMQLMTRFTVGNCCSNFHLLLFDFLRDGCGAARDNVGQCLQENEDPELRVCCMWSSSEECKGKKLQMVTKETAQIDIEGT